MSKEQETPVSLVILQLAMACERLKWRYKFIKLPANSFLSSKSLDNSSILCNFALINSFFLKC